MEQNRPKVPPDAIEAYNEFIHGHLDRRRFLEQLKSIAGAGAAMALYEALTPNYAAAQQVPPTDQRLKTSRETVPTPKGNGEIKGYLARPSAAGNGKLPAILVDHEERRQLGVASGRRTCEVPLDLTIAPWRWHRLAGGLQALVGRWYLLRR